MELVFVILMTVIMGMTVTCSVIVFVLMTEELRLDPGGGYANASTYQCPEERQGPLMVRQ